MQDLRALRITFIGGGNMARGIIGGLLGRCVAPDQITVTAPSESTRNALTQAFGVHVATDNNAAIEHAQVVVLAVKPQLMAEVVRSLAPALQKSKPLVISVAAGIRVSNLASWMGSDIALVRAMPNRPALIGAGATGLYADATTTQAMRLLAETVLGTTGICVWVQRESDMDLVTALSGSGPAYFFRLAELMAEAAVAHGLDPLVARRLAAQTLAGAGQLVAAEADADLGRMRAEVTSKGGTTAAALARFSALDLDKIVAAAMQAAAQRSQELAEQFGSQG